ncbi:outer membrane beta-barrel protein [Polaribacter cellanae]|uniref:Porin family protein n=1 Tax=Polaribacter cellanae TaxID=2818493 RepID=A0A975CSB2_9FLAO|nr:outer membrane beta-barrel protein [Polaribacter cellanae]QTE23037.1 porin family protein [Polaribacter cellanae]
MKALFFITVISLLGLGEIHAQNKISYGAVAGYHNLIGKVKVSENNKSNKVSTGVSGLYAGFFLEYQLSEKFSFQPEVHFAQTYKDGKSSNELIFPMFVKYYVDSKLSLQAGATFDLILDKTEGANVFGFGAGFGLAYDITDKLFASSRYTFGLSNRLKDAPVGRTIKFDIFQIGLGYRF